MSFLDNDDLYSFNEHPLLNTNLQNDIKFQQAALTTSAGRRPQQPTLTSHGARNKYTSAGRNVPGTGLSSPNNLGSSDVRPMTSVKAAGFKRSNLSIGHSVVSQGSKFDPMRGAGTIVDDNLGNNRHTGGSSSEQKINDLEKEVQELIEESITAAAKKEHSKALEKAVSASKKEKYIVQQRETHNLMNNISLDLTFSVCLNLGLQYENNEMYSEASQSYRSLSQNKSFENVGRIKVNMGNIYFKQKDYNRAIKYYQMALDQITAKYKMIRIKIMSNIGAAYLKLAKYEEAIQAFDYIMNEKPDYAPGFQLIVAYYAQNDTEMMKKSFRRLLEVNLGFDLDDHRYQITRDNTFERAYQEAIKNDNLRKLEMERVQTARHYVTSAAKLIAPKIATDESGVAFGKGFDWCVDEVKASRNLAQLSNELEVEKSLALLRAGMPKQAEKLLKAFEKREDTPVRAHASNNLSFMYFNQGNLALADKFADLALEADKYSPAALVNKGNCYFERNQLEEASEFYQQAMNIDATCIEAMYNYAFAQMNLSNFDEAYQYLVKLNTILPGQANVLYLIANVQQRNGDFNNANHWLLQCAGVVRTDTGVLQCLGRNLAEDGDQSQAFSYHYESHKIDPGDLKAIEWLGHYYLESQFPEKAINYFEKAVNIQPTEIKWHLYVVMCLNRAGSYPKAYERLKKVHLKFPDNIDCLKRLVRVCYDIHENEEAKEYEVKLARAVKQATAIEQNRVNSGRIRSGGSNNTGSARGRRERSGHHMSHGPSHLNQTGHSNINGVNMLPPSGKKNQAEEERKQIDTTYDDPIGEQISMRPRTAKNKNSALVAMQDDVNDYDVDDLLPD